MPPQRTYTNRNPPSTYTGIHTHIYMYTAYKTMSRTHPAQAIESKRQTIIFFNSPEILVKINQNVHSTSLMSQLVLIYPKSGVGRSKSGGRFQTFLAFKLTIAARPLINVKDNIYLDRKCFISGYNPLYEYYPLKDISVQSSGVLCVYPHPPRRTGEAGRSGGKEERRKAGSVTRRTT